MLRVNAEVLSKESDRYYYQGNLFTGVAFSVVGCTITKAVQYQIGLATSKYVSEYFLDVDEQTTVNSDCLEPENEGYDEPACYNGTRFSGIAYDFDNNFCTGELHYENGWLGSQINYYLSGKLEFVELIGKDLSQKYYWYENGQIGRFEIFARDLLEIRLAFNQQGEVTLISIDGQYFEKIASFTDKIKYPLFNKDNFISDLIGSDCLNIFGSTVDDELFKRLIAKGGLKNTSKLHIYGTPLAAKSIDELVSIPNIKQILVKSDVLNVEDMKKFKFQRPDCYVELNGEALI